ncbi:MULTISPECIES: GGDEF domain-containing protein [Rhodanobacter]|uniref:GGDEF domain-containing protein n=1 Tax=Rhodanobacter TaxID=75309 RepID=UPI00040A986D|nr:MULTISPECIES: GGDEF domain-containing protein [Rhodanobacter]TAN15619.1 MAG: GGDEF domain-containing protein [Rhodanobacter sp.]UJJ55436.1 GGDEF domain-containing protein [Rhodanobacter thiooxydans]
MYALFKHLRQVRDDGQRREYSRYLAQQMGPMIHALMLVGTLAYLVAVIAGTLVHPSPLPLWLRLAPLPPLLLIAASTRRVRQPGLLSTLTLLCVALLEIGINLNGADDLHRQSVVLPGLLLPVASSVIWLGRWDFIAAMLLCALGPLPMLLSGNIDSALVFQYLVYMAIAIVLSTVLRAFMARTLFEQFRLERQLREQANTDGLTGLLVRNRFLELTRSALAELHRQRQPACMLFVDADRFKQLNDQYGHAAGDAALVALAATLRGQTRAGDLIGRIGGEEFAMLLPGNSLEQGCRRAEQLRQSMHEIQRPDGPLTTSIGVACSPRCRDDIQTLLARADQAMRQAKNAGRDRVVCSPDDC